MQNPNAISLAPIRLDCPQRQLYLSLVRNNLQNRMKAGRSSLKDRGTDPHSKEAKFSTLRLNSLIRNVLLSPDSSSVENCPKEIYSRPFAPDTEDMNERAGDLASVRKDNVSSAIRGIQNESVNKIKSIDKVRLLTDKHHPRQSVLT